jgi:hypothetical protein
MVLSKGMVSLPKNDLMLIAGIVWMFAGTMVIITGFPAFLTMISFFNIFFAMAILLIFYLLIFSRLVKKHTARIRRNQNIRMPFWEFFDAPSYIIMVIMMTGGISLRKFNLIPDYILGPLYTGLGVALFSCGTRFIAVFIRKRVIVTATE